MLQYEFESILGKEVPDADYRLIEIVYQWYPSNHSKEATVSLYKEFGMTLIKDMLPRAEKMKELETRLRRAQGEAARYKELIEEVSAGHDLQDLERNKGE